MKRLILTSVLVLSLGVSLWADEPTDSLTLQLQEVIVSANQPATRLEGSTLVSTIPGSKLENLGTALDVLGQLPMLQVEDNAVSVIGKGSPEIYIDGRPMRDADELQQLRSDNIRKVEVLMAPGAMYSSDTQAVIKITTRHRFVDGLSVTDMAQVKRTRRWSAYDYLDLNYRRGAWDFYVSGTINRNNSQIKGSTTNTFEYDGKETIIGSSQNNTVPTTTGVVKGGFNYAKGDQSFGAYYRFNPERGDFSNNGTEWMDAETPLVRKITKGIRAHSHLGSLYYDNTFGGKYNLHFDGDYRWSRTKDDVATTYPSEDSDNVYSNDKRTSSLWAGKLYLTFPLAKGQFTVGTQDSYTHTTLDFRMLNPEVNEYIPSSLTDARQTSLAAFASWAATFGKFNLSAGLRYEYVDYLFKVNGKKDEDVSRTDNLLTPDISLGYWFNDRSMLSLTYKMATVKPPYSQLTGSLSYVGQHEIEGGNPALKDEHQHDVQFFGMWGDFMLQADYTRSLDSYAFVKRIYEAPTLQLLMQPVNANLSSASLYLVWTRSIKAWQPNVTLGVYKQWLDIAGSTHNKPLWSYYFNNVITLPMDFSLTANVRGQSCGDMLTNRFGASWFVMDASVSKSFFDKALQIKLSATDIFNTRNNNWSMTTYGIHVDSHKSYDTRGISLDITYRFRPVKDKYKGQSAAPSELNRL